MRLADAERLARLRLARTDGVGAVTFARLLERFGSGEAAVRALAGMGRAVAEARIAEDELAGAARVEAEHRFPGEAGYPPLLAELPEPPPVLLTVGDPAHADRPVVAIVGARNASAAGGAMALELAHGLGEAGFTVASGMARGIDAAAHRGSLATGTIACVAGGVDVAYPPENAELQWAVAERGLILSEMPPRTEPMARHFPRRNRLIAGVALGVVVVEAASGSGSLITARLAADAGREVLAVPGHPKDPRSRGGNGLIREGAALVETVADVLAVFAGAVPSPGPVRPTRPAREMRPGPLPAAHAAALPADGGLLALLSVSGVAVDELVRASGLGVADVQARLADLEIEGLVIRMAGGKVARAG